MTVYPINAFSDNYIWAIHEDNSPYFDCVDPGEAEPVLQFARSKQLQLRGILLTHHHDDHIGGVASLSKAFPECCVYAPDDERIPGPKVIVNKDEMIQLGCNHYKVLANPGHTATHISYFEPQAKWLFCGDTLFSAGCGRVFDGTMEELHQSLLMFKNLPPSTKVYCGHEYTRQNLRFALSVEVLNQDVIRYDDQLKQQSALCSLPSTIELEKKINPFFRLDEPAVKAYAKAHQSASMDSLEVFRTLRNQKDIFKN